jgi:hypothetical protein
MGGAAVDLDGGAPPGARASTTASMSSGAAARRGRPRGGEGQARCGLRREEKTARRQPRRSTAASDPPPAREDVASPLHTEAVPTAWEAADLFVDADTRWVEGGKGIEGGCGGDLGMEWRRERPAWRSRAPDLGRARRRRGSPGAAGALGGWVREVGPPGWVDVEDNEEVVQCGGRRRYG